MIYCQSCLTRNPDNAKDCQKCGLKLIILGANQMWEEAEEVPRVSMDDHFLERISNLEETVNNILEHLTRMAESMETMERNAFITRAGLSSLVETLKESHLLRDELLYQRWEATIAEQVEDQGYRERFTQMKSRFLALYRGDVKKRIQFESLIEEADFLIYSDRFGDSIDVLTSALKLDKQNYELAFYLGDIYQNQGLSKEASYFLNIALKANPDHTDSLLALGLIFCEQQEEEEAEKLLVRCVQVNPQNILALMSLAAMFTSQERFDEARPLLEQVNDIEVQGHAFFLLGLGYKHEGKLKPAIDYLKQAVELEPEHEDALFTLGLAYLERGWTRKAQTCFGKAMELNPNFEYQEAARAAIPDGENTPEADHEMDNESFEIFEMAEDLFRKGKLKQSLTQFRKLLKRHPSDFQALSGFATTCFALRRFDEALKIARKIQSMNVSESALRVAYTLEMESLRSLNRYEEAIDCLEEMVRIFPTGPGAAVAAYGLALTKADLGEDLHSAEILAKKALDHCAPEYRHHMLDALGWVYFKQGRYEEALKLVESALNMHETVNQLYHHGMILLALNLKDQAFKAFEKTVAYRNRNASVEDFLFSSIHLDEPN